MRKPPLVSNVGLFLLNSQNNFFSSPTSAESCGKNYRIYFLPLIRIKLRQLGCSVAAVEAVIPCKHALKKMEKNSRGIIIILKGVN